MGKKRVRASREVDGEIVCSMDKKRVRFCRKVVGELLYFVQCDTCDNYILFENCGLGKVFDEEALVGIDFECEKCTLSSCKGGSDLVRTLKAVQLEVKNLSGRLSEVIERVDNLEEKVDMDREISGGVVGQILEEKLKEERGELDSIVAVGVMQITDHVKELEDKFKKLGDRVAAVGVKVMDLNDEWPSIDEGEWVIKEGKRKRKVSGSRPISQGVSFGEKFKGKAHGTVVVMGDSLVRGVGTRLENNHHMFKATSVSGAKLEDVERLISNLEDNEDRHLVLLVGTNNVKRDGSEMMVKKYRKLMETCKTKKNRRVTMVGIPNRVDVDGLANSRRWGVNRRVQKMCGEFGFEYIEYENECTRSKLWRDGLHLNVIGQEELALAIFSHCKRFLV